MMAGEGIQRTKESRTRCSIVVNTVPATTTAQRILAVVIVLEHEAIVVVACLVVLLELQLVVFVFIDPILLLQVDWGGVERLMRVQSATDDLLYWKSYEQLMRVQSATITFLGP
jgi:hypothetical protein